MHAGLRLLVATTNRQQAPRDPRHPGRHSMSSWTASTRSRPSPSRRRPGRPSPRTPVQKAIYYSTRLGVPAVAEDSGLEIDGLGGEPGVHSARYGGPAADTYPQKFALIYARPARAGRAGQPGAVRLRARRGRRREHPLRGARHDRGPRRRRARAATAGSATTRSSSTRLSAGRSPSSTKARRPSVSHRGQAFRQLREYLASHPGVVPVMKPASGPPPARPPAEVRLDVWLDVACLFKTRSEAQKACRGGKVEVNGQSAKPHRAASRRATSCASRGPPAGASRSS